MYIEHNRSIRVDMEVGVGQYPAGVDFFVSPLWRGARGFYIVVIIFLNPHSHAAFCYIISALAISIIEKHSLSLGRYAVF